MTLQDDVLDDVSKLKYPPEVIENWGPVADILSDTFPWKGTKIDWKALVYHAEEKFIFDNEGNIKEIEFFLEKIGANKIINDSERIYYINDSSLDLAFLLKPISFLDFANYVTINIPQHHYFFDGKGRWCLAITSEGYIDFGRSV